MLQWVLGGFKCYLRGFQGISWRLEDLRTLRKVLGGSRDFPEGLNDFSMGF